MPSCCICHMSMQTGQNIYQEYIGEPPVLIRDLLMQCTHLMLHKLTVDTEVCHSCSGKMLRYYEATTIAQEIKQELWQLIENIDTNKLKSDVESIENEVEDETFEELFEEATTENLEVDDEEEEFVVESTIIEKRLVSKSEDHTTEEYVKVEFNCEEDLEQFEELLREGSPLIVKSLQGESDNDTMTSSRDSFSPKVKHEKGKRSGRPPKNEIKDITCAECGEVFHNLKIYEVHYKKEHFKGYICDQCGKIFQSQTGFKTHSATHNPVKRYVCSECGMRYHHKYNLQRHMAWHTGEKPFQCEICSKRFVHRVGLQRHLLIHDNSKRCIECEVCGFKFRTNAHLRRHEMTHTGAKPYSCPICGRCFAQMYNLRVHVREHQQPGSTRQRRLKCKKCSASFTNKQNFEDHKQRHDCDSTSL